MITLFAAPMRRYALRTLSAAALGAMVMPLEQMPVQAQPVIEFDAPGAGNVFPPAAVCNNANAVLAFPGIGCGTTPLANNDSGQVVGTYTDSLLVQHAFLRAQNGQITPIDAPGAGVQGTVAYSINNAGVIAGAFLDSKNLFHGFLRFPWGYFEPLDVPEAGMGAGQGTLALSVNLPGTTTTGIYIGADNVVHGFVLTPANRFESFDATKTTSFTSPCEETCVTPGGAVTGNFVDPTTGFPHGFVRSPSGNITIIDAPNASATLATSINTRGVITGYFGNPQNNGICGNGDQNNHVCGYVLFPSGSFDTFAHDSNFGTEPVSINDAGATTGVSVDANFVWHGFERDADGHFTPFDAADAGTGQGQGQGTRPSTNNSSGEVTGWYIDGNNVNHGFVWQPTVTQ